MRKISKKTIKRIKAGYHDDLMEAIEFLIDTHNENKFDEGYRSCMEDISVRSRRLAEHLHREFNVGNSTDLYATVESLSEVIEEYFTNALKE